MGANIPNGIGASPRRKEDQRFLTGAGNYTDDRSSRVVSPTFTVPAESPRLRFWHWWSFSYYDFGQVQISTNNGESWQPLSATYGADSGGRCYCSTSV